MPCLAEKGGSLLFTFSMFLLVPDFIMFCTNFNDTFLSSEIIIFIEKNSCRSVRFDTALSILMKECGTFINV